MKKLIVMVALGAAAVSTPALAQFGGRGGRGGGHDQTRQEAQQRAEMIFQMIDANRDGVVTRAEAEQAAANFGGRGGGEGGRGGGMMQRIIDQVFATTPTVTLRQFEGMMLARFDAQDLNHDGVLTADERQQARERRGPGAPGAVPPPGAMPPPQGDMPPPPPGQ